MFLSVCAVLILYSGSNHQVLVALSMAGIIISVYPFYHGLKGGTLDLFEPPVMAALLTYSELLRPLFWLSLGGTVLPGYDVSPGQVFRACVRASVSVYVGFAVYYLFYYGLPPLRGVSRVLPSFKPRWSKRRLWLVVPAYFAIGIAAYAIFMWHMGGLDYFLSHINVRSEVSEGQGPLIEVIQAICAAWVIAFVYATSHKRKLWPYVLMGIPVLALLSTLGGRGFLLYPVLLCFICHHYLTHRMSFALLALVAVCFVTFAVAFKTVRDSVATERQIGVQVLEESRWSPNDLFSQLFQEQTSLDAFAVLIDDMPAHLQFQWGRTWLNLLTLPIPSKLWTGKPAILEGHIFGEIYFDESSGRPPGYAGVLYMNFGYLGIVPGFALLAVFHRFLYRYLTNNRTNGMAVCLYALTAITLFDFSNIQIMHWLYWGPWLLLGFGIIGTTSLPRQSCVSAGEYARCPRGVSPYKTRPENRD
jgi:oligosaccharide repeat unit polymerase